MDLEGKAAIVTGAAGNLGWGVRSPGRGGGSTSGGHGSAGVAGA